jgi:hypothetical protein
MRAGSNSFKCVMDVRALMAVKACIPNRVQPPQEPTAVIGPGLKP